ncbi:uncharacterized protein LOC144153416 [Haemaphysalis longicornis]
MLPFVLFMDLNVEQHPLYFKISAELLHEMAIVLMVASVDATSVLCRVALYAMTLFGTRLRTLICGCAAGAALCTLVMSGTAAVLIMAAIAQNIVQLLQNDIVQVFQQRALFDKATVGLSSLRRRLLEDILWPRRFGDREPLVPPTSTSPKSLFFGGELPTLRQIRKSSSTECRPMIPEFESLPKLANPKYANSWVLDFLTDTNVTDDQLIHREVSRASAPCSTDTPDGTQPRHSPPRNPTMPSKSSLSLHRMSRPLRKTSILEDGQVLMPGQSSPEPKPSRSNDPYRRTKAQYSHQRRQLQQIVAWKKERYQTIHCHLVMAVVVASSLSSMLSKAYNSVQRNVIGYLESRFRQSIMTPAIWWIMLLPAEAFGIAAFWWHVHFSFLKTFDAPEHQEAQISIQFMLQKIYNDVGLFRYTELVPTTLLLTWILANYFNVVNSRGPFDFIDYRELVDFDYLVVILTFIIPWRRWYNDQVLDFRHMVRRLPWGAFLIYFGSLHLGFIIKAISNGCHPLFFALPVLVGASTSVIFPMGSMALALMNSVTNVGARDMPNVSPKPSVSATGTLQRRRAGVNPSEPGTTSSATAAHHLKQEPMKNNSRSANPVTRDTHDDWAAASESLPVEGRKPEEAALYRAYATCSPATSARFSDAALAKGEPPAAVASLAVPAAALYTLSSVPQLMRHQMSQACQGECSLWA